MAQLQKINQSNPKAQFDKSDDRDYSILELADDQPKTNLPKVISAAMALNEAARKIGRGKFFWVNSGRMNRTRGDASATPLVFRREVWTVQETEMLDNMGDLRARIEYFCADQRLAPQDTVLPVDVQFPLEDKDTEVDGSLVAFTPSKTKLNHAIVAYIPEPYLFLRANLYHGLARTIQKGTKRMLNMENIDLPGYRKDTNKDIVTELNQNWGSVVYKFEDVILETYKGISGLDAFRTKISNNIVGR